MFPLGVLRKKASQGADPALTLALLHFDGADGSTVFTDSSPYNQTVTACDNLPTISSVGAEAGFGNRGLFSGSQGLRITPSEVGQFAFGSDDFTIEFKFEATALGGYRCFVIDGASGGASSFFVILDSDNSNKLSVLFKTTITTRVLRHHIIPALNTKYHCAVVRHNGYIDLYLNGVRATDRMEVGSEVYLLYSGDLIIGRLGFVSGYYYEGYMDEFRLRKEAMYDADFTPPSSAFTF